MKLFSRARLAHPAYLIYFVTSRCMGRCRHCFYWESINQPEDPLTVSEVEKTASSMGRLLQVTFTGGEPFLRDDFIEVVKVFYRVNKLFHVGIATSGFHPDKVEQGVRRLLDECPDARITVGLPVEGPRELNDHIRGRVGFYQRTIESLKRLQSLKEEERLTILVDITASGFNRGALLETYTLVRDHLGPHEINLILTRGVPREEGAKDLDPGEVAKLLSVMEEDIKRGRFRGYGFLSGLLHAKDVMLRRMALDIFEHGTFHLPCQAGRVAGVLMPEGELYPCELWKDSMGNVREAGYSVPALWTGEKADEIRRQIIESRCTCFHQCFLSNTIFWNPRAWPKMLREWAGIKT